MSIDESLRAEVQTLLRGLGLASRPLTVSDGFSNLVLLTDAHVIRLNTGRFADAFAHEADVLAHLPPEIPHPAPIAHGPRRTGDEYLILERLPGVTLESAWPSMSAAERQAVGRELGSIVQMLHSLPLADWMRNPWLERALESETWADAYHAPPDRFGAMVASAGARRPAIRSLLADVASFIADRMDAFARETQVFAHADLHFRNVIVDRGHVSGLIDFEGSRPAPPDFELDMLLRSMSADDLRRAQILGPMAETYPGLFAHPNLAARLEVQEAMWLLVQIHHWRPGQVWMEDPGQLLGRLLDGGFRAWSTALLADARGA